MYAVDEEECTGCGICLEYCPSGAITVQYQAAEIDQDMCTSCGSCAEACPQNAIYEYEDVPALYESARAVAASTEQRAPVAVGRKPSALARREKVVAAAVLVPTLSRILLRLVGRISLRGGDRNPLSSGFEQRQPAGRVGRGGHRWHGGH
jgi:ferredoxin